MKIIYESIQTEFLNNRKISEAISQDGVSDAILISVCLVFIHPFMPVLLQIF